VAQWLGEQAPALRLDPPGVVLLLENRALRQIEKGAGESVWEWDAEGNFIFYCGTDYFLKGEVTSS
jgi:hypothetical protein